MRANAYRIVDEPRAKGLAHLAVGPTWPLLGMMLGGAWLAWPWFLLNAAALGEPRFKRTLATVALAFGGSVLLALAIDAAFEAGRLPAKAIPWVSLALVVWKLTFAYVLNEQQTGTAELFRFFGGRLRNAAPIVIGALVVGRPALEKYGSDFIYLVLT